MVELQLLHTFPARPLRVVTSASSCQWLLGLRPTVLPMSAAIYIMNRIITLWNRAAGRYRGPSYVPEVDAVGRSSSHDEEKVTTQRGRTGNAVQTSQAADAHVWAGDFRHASIFGVIYGFILPATTSATTCKVLPVYCSHAIQSIGFQ